MEIVESCLAVVGLPFMLKPQRHKGHNVEPLCAGDLERGVDAGPELQELINTDTEGPLRHRVNPRSLL